MTTDQQGATERVTLESDRIVLRERGATWVDGVPANLAAAAMDAGEWLDLIERMHALGRWPFSEHDTLTKLRGCREHLRVQLEAAHG